MPNWCSNTLEIRGEADAVTKFKRDQEAIPKEWEGEDFREMEHPLTFCHSVWDEEFAATNAWSYEWCCKNWGTKWGPCDTMLSDFPGGMHYTFNTAWSPPLAWLTKVAGDYPHLRFVLGSVETGCDFLTVYGFAGGKEVFSDEVFGLYDITSQEAGDGEEGSDRWYEVQDQLLHKKMAEATYATQ